MNRRVILSLPLLLILAVGSGRAEEKIKVGEVVVTATRTEESLEETTSDVVVVNQKAIRQMNVNFVPDVLRKISDINVVQNGGDGKVATVFLRGGASNQTLVLIDGVKVNSPSTGGFDFSGVSVDDIERIEIVKGAQSTIYGSEAMAGVINIITRKGEGRPRADMSLEAGSFGTYKPSATVSGATEVFNYRVTASYFDTDGISVAQSGSERDSYTNAFVSWKLGFNLSKNVEFETFGKYSSDRSALDTFDFQTGLETDALNFIQHTNAFLLSGRAKVYLVDKWEQVYTISTERESSRFRDADVSFNNIDFINKRYILDWQNNVYLSNAVTFTAGLEYRNEGTENKGNFTETVNNSAAYLLAKVKAFDNRLVVNAGLRYDDTGTAGSKTTYRLGALYTLKEADLTFRGSYATGFRAPSLNELFFPFFGNPDLKPEESQSFEIGVRKDFMKGKASLSLTYFNERYTNLISYDFATLITQNIAEAKVKGVEANATVNITESLLVKAGYTYLDTEDEATGKQLPRRPQNKFTAGLSYAWKNLSLLADAIYVGERFDSAAGDTVPSYWVVNVSGNYKVNNTLSLFARIENLFDKEYEEVKGFGTKGFSLYGGIRATF